MSVFHSIDREAKLAVLNFNKKIFSFDTRTEEMCCHDTEIARFVKRAAIYQLTPSVFEVPRTYISYRRFNTAIFRLSKPYSAFGCRVIEALRNLDRGRIVIPAVQPLLRTVWENPRVDASIANSSLPEWFKVGQGLRRPGHVADIA